MKFAQLLVFLTIATPFASAVASEMDTNDNDIQAYCTEQAQLAGIEDSVERDEYIAECIESFSIPESNQASE